MSTNARKTVLIGDLVVAAFDKAAQRSTDPEEVSRLATDAVSRILQRANRQKASRLGFEKVRELFGFTERNSL